MILLLVLVSIQKEYVRDIVVKNSSPKHEGSTSLLSSQPQRGSCRKSRQHHANPSGRSRLKFSSSEKTTFLHLPMNQVVYFFTHSYRSLLCSFVVAGAHCIFLKAVWSLLERICCVCISEVLISSSQASSRAVYLPVEVWPKRLQSCLSTIFRRYVLSPTLPDACSRKQIVYSSLWVFSVLYNDSFWTKLIAKC